MLDCVGTAVAVCGLPGPLESGAWCMVLTIVASVLSPLVRTVHLYVGRSVVLERLEACRTRVLSVIQNRHIPSHPRLRLVCGLVSSPTVVPVRCLRTVNTLESSHAQDTNTIAAPTLPSNNLAERCHAGGTQAPLGAGRQRYVQAAPAKWAITQSAHKTYGVCVRCLRGHARLPLHATNPANPKSRRSTDKRWERSHERSVSFRRRMASLPEGAPASLSSDLAFALLLVLVVVEAGQVGNLLLDGCAFRMEHGGEDLLLHNQLQPAPRLLGARIRCEHLIRNRQDLLPAGDKIGIRSVCVRMQVRVCRSDPTLGH
jgi:hypothetical protein